MAEEREAPSDAAVGVGNSVSDGTFHAPVVQAGSVSGGVHTYYTQPPYSSLPPVSEWPELDTADPVALGVRRTRCLPGESLLPPYVGRDCDAELDDRIGEAARSGGLVVVTGAPLSGKSRTMWCALFTNLSMTTRIFAPQPGTDLRGLPAVLRGRGKESCLLWLDDLEGHLGEHGLTPTLLAELVRLRVPVLGTMDDKAYDVRRFGTSARAGVLSGVEPVELQRKWSSGEQRRLSDLLAVPRLRAAALVRGGHTAPEYLALGPELMEEWRRARRPDAHPRGHLIVRAAMDLGRCGLRRAYVSRDVLRRAQALYPQELSTAGPESFEDGLAWASGLRHGVTGLLVPGDDPDTWAAFGSLVADADDRVDSPPVPLGMWSLALSAATDLANRNKVWASVQRLLGPRGTGEPEVAAVLGDLYAAFGQRGMAKQWFRTAADAGHREAAAALGELLVSLDEPAEAMPYLEQAAEAGLVRSQYLLGKLLADRAQHWLARAAQARHPEAIRALPPLRAAIATPPDTVEE
ncbi:tetratricopeptide repeat protein [Streptomyces bacillaris]|uniref:tetratricopeptide repeat protein n=1 Tax=Streptomyces bacillaris TaxID=68179 RepID=UPI00382CC11E